MVQNIKVGIRDPYVCKNKYVKEKLRQPFFIDDWFYSQVFAKTLAILGFRWIIISDKFPVFGVKILPQKINLFFFKFINDNA